MRECEWWPPPPACLLYSLITFSPDWRVVAAAAVTRKVTAELVQRGVQQDCTACSCSAAAAAAAAALQISRVGTVQPARRPGSPRRAPHAQSGLRSCGRLNREQPGGAAGQRDGEPHGESAGRPGRGRDQQQKDQTVPVSSSVILAVIRAERSQS